MSTSFDSLELRPELRSAIEQIGYVTMTPIQAETLPVMLAGHDVMGQAKTGSGKTAAFGLALLERIDPNLASIQGLVMCPTRELADQVANELRRLAQRMDNVRVVSVCGGRPSRDQAKALKAGSQVVVGTPGRLGKHLSDGNLRLRDLRILVLDEADRMLDMGFVDQVQIVVRRTPKTRQTLFFSATFSEEIEALSAQVQRDAQGIAVASQVEPGRLRQRYFQCERGERRDVLVRVLAKYRPETALLFCETRDDCETLTAFLNDRGAVALPLHGQMEQRDRDEVLLRFANGSASLLVATNVAARGIDIPNLPAVVITELSKDPESHLHRIGRTGRAGESGFALSIVAGPKERVRLQRIEEYMGEIIERKAVPSPARGLHFLSPPNNTLLILSGRKDKLRKGDVLGALVKDGGVPTDAIGRIDLMENTCAVAVAKAHAREALAFLRRGRIKKKHVRAIMLGDAPKPKTERSPRRPKKGRF